MTMPENLPAPILCSTARLARSLRLAHCRRLREQGLAQWQPLPALTLSQWLANTVERALLQGTIGLAETPRMVLSTAQELVLWERVIERTQIQNAALFDSSGLAKTAMEANQLMQEWNIAIAADAADAYRHSTEVAQFLQWRAEFRQQCRAAGWLEATRYIDWQIAQLDKGAGNLPQQLYIAGYDRISPQEQRLFDALSARGVKVERWPHLLEIPSVSVQASLADCEAECRAAVAWVAHKLASNPQARLAIVAPELGNLRERLSALLDDSLHPWALSPAQSEAVRSYDLSLGTALSRHPLVSIALALLRLAANRRHISQQDFSQVLLSPYWSASSTEADARAQLDARMRADLSLNITLERLLRFVSKQQARGLAVMHLTADLQAMLDALVHLPSRQLPSQWVDAIASLLQAIHWPGERSISSHEYQARNRFNQVLATLADFDAVIGTMSFPQAVQRLSQLCAEQVFQPESPDDPQILVMGMLETVAAPLDAMWVMGMNDQIWPPTARANPLLPAALQRAARAPGADGPVQTEFAQAIHARLLKSAHEIVFSWARKSGESELRVSPLMAGIATRMEMSPLAETLAEKLASAEATAASRQWLDDHVAPAVTPSERVSGGAGLIRAQAICPAWAYYRYRLGARPLDEPIDGLDAMGRGNLVHAVLQSFWQQRDSAYLQGLDETALPAAITHAVEQGVASFSRKLEEPLPPNFLVLEKQRLRALLTAWLAFEKLRPPFTVAECEQRVELDIAGLAIRLTLDRVDRLADGKLIVIDYKTGASISHHSWAETRIAEPQLPLYSALVLADQHIAAVCFAQVRADEQRFIGIAADAETLPGIKALQEATRLFPPETFPDWLALLSHWKSSIEAIAGELVGGEAGVFFQDENDLRDCEVRPLLRLPERYLQIEAVQQNMQKADA